MLSPLFFNSKPCRDEVRQFLEHERALNRDDLILPVYFLSSAKVEKEEQRNNDPLVKELAKRHMFDWREKANVSLQEPAGSKAILELAGKIAKALERLEEFRPAREAQRPRPEGGYEFLAADPRLGAGIAGNLKREEMKPRTILWVDDNPDNNIWERRALESYGIRFLHARDTPQAQKLLLERGPLAAIISDMARDGDPKAGYTLLDRVRKAEIHTPYFIYTSGLAAKLWPIARVRGARGSRPIPMPWSKWWWRRSSTLLAS